MSRRRTASDPSPHEYVAAVAVLSCGIASFQLLAFHAQTQWLLTAAQIPVLFAVAMLIDGLSGLVMGRVYDRRGPKVLLVLPVAASAAAIGVAIWASSTACWTPPSKPLSQLIPANPRAPAFGWLALVRGLGLLIAGGILGLAYDHGITLVIDLIIAANIIAGVGLWSVLRRDPSPRSPRQAMATR